MKLPVKVVRELNISPCADDGTPFLSAGSGLARIKKWMYIAADDELSVGVFPVDSMDAGKLYTLFDGILSTNYKLRKREKPDIEAILLMPDDTGLLLIPSGSRNNRVRGSLVVAGPNGEIGKVHAVDFSQLFNALSSHINGLNIEGATIFRDVVLLFQRGNNTNGENAIITLDYKKFAASLFAERKVDASCLVCVTRCSLRHIENVPLSFTDACTLDDKHIVFVATAEDTDNPYDDGVALGSVVGILDYNFQVIHQHTLDFPDKVEGVWIAQKSMLPNWDGEVLLVSDADDRRIPAKLLSAKVPL